MNMCNTILVLISVHLSIQLVLKGPCPTIKSKVDIYSYPYLSAELEVPFEIFIPNYLIFPYASHEKVTVNPSLDLDILLIDLWNSDCKAGPGIRFNNQTKSPEVLLLSHIKSKTKKPTKKDIICRIKINFQLAMILIEDCGILWGCAEINETFHDEALIVLKIERKTVIDISRNASEFKSKGLQLLENRSQISENDLKNCILDQFRYENDSNLKTRSAHCETLKCNHSDWHWIVCGIVIVKLIIFIVIDRISIYCERNNVIYF